MVTDVVGVALPAERGGGLDREAWAPRAAAPTSRYASSCSAKSSHDGIDTTRVATPSAASRRGRLDAHVHLAAGADEHEVGLAVGLDEHVAAPQHALVAGGALEHGHVLAGEDERGRAVAVDGDAPRLRRLVGVGRADHAQLRHGPHRRELLDRLVGRAVLAEPDRVVGPAVDDVGLAQRGQAHRRAHVVAEARRTCRRTGARRRAAPCRSGSPPMPCSRTPK